MTWVHRLRISLAIAAIAGCGSDPEEDSAPATTTEEACDRTCLIELARAVATGARTLDANTRLTENGAEIDLADSWLARASDVNIHGDYADASKHTGIVIGTGTDGNIPAEPPAAFGDNIPAEPPAAFGDNIPAEPPAAFGDNSRPTIFGLRLRHRDGETSEAELILAHAGEASLFPTAIPIARNAIMSEIVPAELRTPPERMIEVANAYFDGIEVASGANVPVTGDCNRIENGVQVTNSERSPNLKCNSLEGFDYITEVRERRFPVVDVERGVVVAHVAFYIPGGDYERIVNGMATTRHYDPRALFLIEAFKIEAGQARLIEATMRNMPLGATMGWP